MIDSGIEVRKAEPLPLKSMAGNLLGNRRWSSNSPGSLCATQQGGGRVEVRAPASWPESTLAVDSRHAQNGLHGIMMTAHFIGVGACQVLCSLKRTLRLAILAAGHSSYSRAQSVDLTLEWQRQHRRQNGAGSRGYRGLTPERGEGLWPPLPTGSSRVCTLSGLPLRRGLKMPLSLAFSFKQNSI